MRKSNVGKYVHTYLTHSELFGTVSSMENVYSMIQSQVEPSVFLAILSQLASIKNGYDSIVFKEDFLKEITKYVTMAASEHNMSQGKVNECVNLVRTIVGKRALYSHQSILNTWKYVLVYGRYDPTNEPTVELFNDQYMKAFILSLWLSDHMVTNRTDIVSEVFQNYVFNENRELVNALARTMHIFTDIARDRTRIQHQDYFDVDNEFASHYGFNLEDYITATFGIYTMFVTKTTNGRIVYDWYQSVEHCFQHTKLREIAIDVLHPLTFDFNEGKTEVNAALNKWWDFGFFYDKPIFNLREDIVFPVSLPLLENALYEGLFWKIRNCYPRHDVRFQNFFGKPFELYVEDLLKESSRLSPLCYEVTPQFRYTSPTNGQMNDSPDVMLRLGTTLLAVEAKSQRLNFRKSVIEGDAASIEADRIKMTVEPMQQLYTRVSELLSGQVEEANFNDVKEVFLIVVNNGTFPTLHPFAEKTRQDWSKLSGISVTVHTLCMNIEELELLAGLLERSSPVFKVLRHKMNFHQFSFKNFVFNQRLRPKPPALCERVFGDLASRFSSHLEMKPMPQ